MIVWEKWFESRPDVKGCGDCMQKRNGWRTLLTALGVFSLACCLLQATPTVVKADDSGPRVVFLSPQPGEVIPTKSVLVVFQIDSNFPIARYVIDLSGGQATYNWGAEPVVCSSDYSRCEVTLEFFSSDCCVYTSDGPQFLTGYAVDVNGIRGPQSRVDVILSRNDSGAILYAPESGETLSGVVLLKAARTNRAKSVDFYVDGVPLKADLEYCGGGLTCQVWDTRGWSNGVHTVAVGGYDGNHDPPGPPITVTVKNPVQTNIDIEFVREDGGRRVVGVTVRLTSPQGNAYMAGREVTLALQTPTGSTLVGRKPANTAGVAEFAVDVSGASRFSARVDADRDFLGASVSRPAGRLNLNFAASSRSLRVGEVFTWRVVATPARIHVFDIQVKLSGAWTTWRSYRTNASGSWRSQRWVLSRPGKVSYRVHVAESKWFEAATSNDLVMSAR